MILRTGVSLAAEARRALARLRLVVGQHVVGILPLGVLVHQVALLVQGVQRVGAVQSDLGILQGLQLFDVVNRWALVLHAMGEGAVQSVLDAVAPTVGVVDAHACLVVAQVVPSLRVPGGAVKEGASAGWDEGNI